MVKVTFRLNGKAVTADERPGRSLLGFLRGRGIFSVKHGCDHGECGACAVLIDGKAYNSCLVLLHTLEGREVETVEALEERGKLHPIQERFLAEGAVQCGICTPGMIISLEALFRENGAPDEAAVRDALTGNLCRCTGYVKPVNAALSLAETDRDE